MAFFRTLALLAAAATLSSAPVAAGSMRALAAPSAFTWVDDPHAADPCTEPGCVNHVKYGYNVVPVNITSDAKVVMQEAKRPAGLAAVLNLKTYTQPGCAISGCRMTKTFGIFPKEDCFNVQVSKTADQPDGKTTCIDFGGIYYENLPSGELYIKYEKKNYLTNANTCTYEIRSGYKRWF